MNTAAIEFIQSVGGALIAREVGISRQAVWNWRKFGIPPDRVPVLKSLYPAAWAKYGRHGVSGGRGNWSRE